MNTTENLFKFAKKFFLLFFYSKNIHDVSIAYVNA